MNFQILQDSETQGISCPYHSDELEARWIILCKSYPDGDDNWTKSQEKIFNAETELHSKFDLYVVAGE